MIPVTSSICNLTNQSEVNNFFKHYTDKEKLGNDVADKVIHCAAKVGGVNYNMTHKGEFFYDNIMINTNVIEAARIHGIKKLVTFLSKKFDLYEQIYYHFLFLYILFYKSRYLRGKGYF